MGMGQRYGRYLSLWPLSKGTLLITLSCASIKIDRLTSIKAKPILRFERKDTSRKGAKEAKFGKDLLTADFHRLSQIYADQRSVHRAKRIAQSDKRRRTAGLAIFHTREERNAHRAKRIAQSDKRRRTAGLAIFHTREERNAHRAERMARSVVSHRGQVITGVCILYFDREIRGQVWSWLFSNQVQFDLCRSRRLVPKGIAKRQA